jgi:hypothetical protein
VNRSSSESRDQRTPEVAVACHVHSEWSYDGKWSLPALAREFRRRGYRAVMMTEHDRGFTEERWTDYQAACAAASSEEMLLVPGIEYSDPTNVVHILVWGCSTFLGEGLSTAALLSAVREHGAIAVLAHPSRLEAWRRFDPAWAGRLLGIELWNRKTDGWAPSKSAAKLLSRTGISSFVGLDFHARNQFFPMAMKVRISNAFSGNSIVESLRIKAFSATAFGRPVDSLSHGFHAPSLEVAEFFRRRAASVYRSWQRN